jgi:hypothetical protein
MKKLVVVLALTACSSSPPPCTVALGTGADLVLTGSGSCSTSLRLGLRVATGSPDSPVWSDAAASPLSVEGAWTARGNGAVRSVSVVNHGTASVTLVGLEWSTDAGGVGLPVDRMVHDGYQSWSYTGVESIPASMADVNGTAPHGGDNENVIGEKPGVSWWWTALSDATGNGLVAGADGGTVLKTYVAADGATPVRLRIVQGVTGDAVVLGPGESKTLDGLYVALGDVRSLLEDYAKYVASLHPPAVPRSPALGGWGSWNMYYANITAAALRSEAQFATSTLAPAGLSDFLLDDGYEVHWGSWSASPTFGADLQTLAAEQTAAGLRPAIWLAPFYVATSDALVTQHPEWFVHNGDGTLRTYPNSGDNAALDVTQQGARDFVTQSVQQLRAWGFRTLKIDFLFGAALEGVRAQPVTSLESFQTWMKTLRDAVPDVHLVGCGAPMLPSVGWVDSMRIGPDIAFYTSPVPQYPFLSTEARHVAMRASTDAWWSLDPDVVLTRGTSIDDTDAWTVVVFGAMAGGNYLLGDPSETTDLRRTMETAPEILAMTRDGVAARATDLVGETDPTLFETPIFIGNNDTAVPHVWTKKSKDGAHGWMAVFAWAEDPYVMDVEVPSGAYEIVAPTAPGSSLDHQPFSSGSVTVPKHAARLFAW